MIRPMTVLSDITRNPDFLRRIGVTLAALAVYRAGCWVPLPGVDVGALIAHYQPGHFDSAIGRISLMALGLTPVLSALILVELAMIVWPRLRAWAASGSNATHLDGWTTAGALALATLQANGIAKGLEGIQALVPNPGLAFRAGIIVSMVAATAILIRLAALITRHGIGSGIWVLIGVPYLVSFVQALIVQAGLWGPFSPVTVSLSLGYFVLIVAVLAALSKSAPALAERDELIWAPILGFAIPGWLVALAWIALWLLLPDGPAQRFETVLSSPSLGLLALVTLPLVVLLRRRSMPNWHGRSGAASAMPLAAALIALAGLGLAMSHMAALPLFPTPGVTIILAAIGLAIAEGFERALTEEPGATRSESGPLA
jgi:preprotein translocase subunit SecY